MKHQQFRKHINKPLSVLGIGPIAVAGITIIFCIFVHYYSNFNFSKFFYLNDFAELKLYFYQLFNYVFYGTSFKLLFATFFYILCGFLMWWFAVFKSKIVSNIKHKKLVVTGVYSLVRNPMYAAFLWIYFSLMMLICSSIISIVYYYVCWLYLTILIKYTEERWLLAVFGEEYKEYCNNVSRLFPYGKDIIDNIKSKFVKKSN